MHADAHYSLLQQPHKRFAEFHKAYPSVIAGEDNMHHPILCMRIEDMNVASLLTFDPDADIPLLDGQRNERLCHRSCRLPSCRYTTVHGRVRCRLLTDRFRTAERSVQEA